jgi:hypothetical protein
MKPIRVGLIRCDTHAAYYAALFDKFDPRLFKDPGIPAARCKYSWQSGAVRFLYHTDCYTPDEMTVSQVRGMALTRVWDPDIEMASLFARVFGDHPTVCRRFEEVSDDVDVVFLAECNGDGSDHLELASPGIRKGVPTFLDKPFAYGIGDAVKLVALAEKHRVPIMSSSILRAQPEGAQFRARLAELDPLKFGEIIGYGGSMANAIHSLSLAQNAFGSGVTSVECMGQIEVERILLRFGQRADRPLNGVIVHCLPGIPGRRWTWNSGLFAVASSPERCIVSHGMTDYNFPAGAKIILERIKKMVKTRAPQMPYSEMIELIGIAEAARKSQREHRPVALKEVSRVFRDRG